MHRPSEANWEANNDLACGGSNSSIRSPLPKVPRIKIQYRPNADARLASTEISKRPLTPIRAVQDRLASRVINHLACRLRHFCDALGTSLGYFSILDRIFSFFHKVIRYLGLGQRRFSGENQCCSCAFARSATQQRPSTHSGGGRRQHCHCPFRVKLGSQITSKCVGLREQNHARS